MEGWKHKKVHALSRLLAGNEVNVKRRIVGQWRFVPEYEQLEKMLVEPALAGGLQAELVDLEQQKLQWADPAFEFACSEPASPDYNHVRQAKRDIASTSFAMKKALEGKTFPAWSLPIEVWLMVLLPDYVSVRDFPTAGLGAAKP